ncbi:hypothetical protein PsorP6_005309 [Peronosclerospora sorghi]|uniref:Uncharacterized protein n=2 Tax=Peronosclerospora sorghi TaxID=230839 RepID=A0ACC0W5A8_9STRA|nr:hypothetical protein PsorP6_005311 [Peronosclerospora sorghi]KAI9913815.1 hypothetical protein PsorP6_005309 [Peronosclerospora sorghi]
MYSIECVVSLLEVDGAMNVLEEVERQAEDATQSSWLDGNVSCHAALRRVLCAHVEYKKLVKMLVVVAIDPKTQRWHHSVMKTLTLLGEENSFGTRDARRASVKHAVGATSQRPVPTSDGKGPKDTRPVVREFLFGVEVVSSERTDGKKVARDVEKLLQHDSIEGEALWFCG